MPTRDEYIRKARALAREAGQDAGVLVAYVSDTDPDPEWGAARLCYFRRKEDGQRWPRFVMVRVPVPGSKVEAGVYTSRFDVTHEIANPWPKAKKTRKK